MNNQVALRRAIVATFGLLLTVAVTASAQQQAPAGAPQGKTAEQVFKNIQVLNGVPASQVIPAMHVIQAALNVDCEFCHVEGDNSKDDKKPKQTARKMMTMMFDINKNSFNGRQEVTCGTCHHATNDPSNVPEFLTKAPEPEKEGAPASLPSADQIFAKYVQALGGEQALRKVTTRVITGTRDIPTGPGGAGSTAAQFEMYEKAPNLAVSLSRMPKGSVSEGFDGTIAWAQDMKGAVNVLPNPDQMRAKRDADLYHSLDLSQEFTKVAVRGTGNVNGHDAYVVVGTPQNDSNERLYFDVQTGLLLRRVTYLATPVGRSPYQVDYDDYRDTGDGTKFPFVIHMTPGTPRLALASHSTIQVQKVQDNVPVEDAKFSKPESKVSSAAE